MKKFQRFMDVISIGVEENIIRKVGEPSKECIVFFRKIYYRGFIAGVIFGFLISIIMSVIVSFHIIN